MVRRMRSPARLSYPRALLVALFTLALAKPAFAADSYFSDPVDDVHHVMTLLLQRLQLMPAVAAWKWRHHAAISDPAREALVLDQTSERARLLGIEPQSARLLFELQIALAREVQERQFALWQRQGFDESLPATDLATDLRPHLDKLGDELLQSLAIALPSLRSPAVIQAAVKSITPNTLPDDDQLERLSLALSQLRSASMPTLDRVRATHVIRVGMTGDYAPFSSDTTGTLRGIDVELANAFAATLGAQPKFVRTHWSTLMSDYAAGTFDVAMSGVSVTPERSAAATFSISYHQGGKMPIARCGDVARYRSLAAIDRPQVRAIVNPGGTNESFTRAQLHQAQIILHPDNRTIFDELLAGHADVMITDDVEVNLQHVIHPQLCGTLKAPLNHASKAWLLPHDDAFAAAANEWLRKRVKDGTVARLMRNELDAASK